MSLLYFCSDQQRDAIKLWKSGRSLTWLQAGYPIWFALVYSPMAVFYILCISTCLNMAISTWEVERNLADIIFGIGVYFHTNIYQSTVQQQLPPPDFSRFRGPVRKPVEN